MAAPKPIATETGVPAPAPKEKFMTSMGERFSYGFYFLGQNIFYILLGTFLLTFFTDVGIPPATVAILMLVVKIWDAINDPIFGGLVDKIKFKSGKFLPWLRISLVAIPLATIFLFAIPKSDAFPLSAKIAWAVLAYILWDTSYTICDVPIFGIVTTMTDKQQERTTLMSIGRVCALCAAIIVTIVVPGIREAIGGWLPTILLLSVIGLLTMLPICFTAKERIVPRTSQQEVGLKQMFTYIFKNKYMLILYGGTLIAYSANIGQSIGLIFARVCLGNEKLLSVLSLAALFPAIVLGMFIPALAKKFDKFTLYFWANLINGALGIVVFFAGYNNFYRYVALTVLRGIPMGAVIMLMFMFTPDCAEYATYKTGISAPGVAFSIQTFSVKLMAAISTFIAALALSLIGFVEKEGAIQPAGFEGKLWAVYTLVPAFGSLLSLLILNRYKLRDKYVQIMAQFNAGEISREEAESSLAGKI